MKKNSIIVLTEIPCVDIYCSTLISGGKSEGQEFQYLSGPLTTILLNLGITFSILKFVSS